MKVKTLEANTVLLDWAVAVCEKADYGLYLRDGHLRFPASQFTDDNDICSYLNNADACLTIIMREGIDTRQYKRPIHELLDTRHFDKDKGDVLEYVPAFKREMVKRLAKPSEYQGYWFARYADSSNATVRWNPTDCASPTLPLAALRCYVLKNLGPELEVPPFIAESFN